MVVGTVVTPKLSHVHESATVQKGLINRNIFGKITWQEMKSKRFAQCTIQCRWVFFQASRGPMAGCILPDCRCLGQISTKTMGVDELRQCVHVEGEEACGFGSLRSQEPLCKVHVLKPWQLAQKL